MNVEIHRNTPRLPIIDDAIFVMTIIVTPRDSCTGNKRVYLKQVKN